MVQVLNKSVLACLVFICIMNTAEAGASDAFQVWPATNVSNSTRLQLLKESKRLGSVRCSMLNVDFDRIRNEILSNSNSASLIFIPFKETQIQIDVTYLNKYSDKKIGIAGEVRGKPGGTAVIVVSDNKLSANIRIDGRLIVIRSFGDSIHGVFELDPNAQKNIECETDSENKFQKLDNVPLDSWPIPEGENYNVDVLVVYTPDAAEMVTDINQEIDLMETEANFSYLLSEIDLRISIINRQEIEYSESNSIQVDRDRLQAEGDGYLDEVHTLRETFFADIVVLLEDPAQACGIAYIMEEVTTSFEDHAFAVVNPDPNSCNLTFAHEIGHIMSARHDRMVDNTDGFPFSFNHGYVNVDSQWRTVMAYNTECADNGVFCSRIQRWSNPDIQYFDEPLGIPEGDPQASDNHKTLNTTASIIAGFRSDRTLYLSAVPNPVPQYGQCLLQATLLDDEGVPIGDEPIEFMSDFDGSISGGNISGNVASTGGNGRAPINFVPSAPPGTAGKIFARCQNNPEITAEILLLIGTSDGLDIGLTAVLTERSDTFSRFRIRVTAQDAMGEAVAGAAVTLVTTVGVVEDMAFETDGYGVARGYIYTEESGLALITASVDGVLAQVTTYFKVGPVPPLSPVFTLDYSEYGVGSYAWSQDGEMLAVGCQNSGSGGNRIDILDRGSFEIITQLFSDEGNTDGVSFSPDGTKLAVGANGAFEIYDISTGSLLNSTEDPDANDDSRFMSWIPSNKIIAEGSYDSVDNGPIVVLNQSLDVTRYFQYQGRRTRSYGYNPTADKLWLCVTQGTPDVVAIYNLNSSSPQRVIEIDSPHSAGFDPSGTKIITNRDNDWLPVYSVSTGNQIAQISGDFTDQFACFDWSIHSETIAGADEDGTLWIINYDQNLNTGFVESTAQGAGYTESVVRWNPEGYLLAIDKTNAINFYSPLDFDPPQLGITFPPTGLETESASISVTGWATDMSGIDRVIVESDTETVIEDNLINNEFSIPVNLNYGSNSVVIMAHDKTMHEAVIGRIVTRKLQTPTNFVVSYGVNGGNSLSWVYENQQDVNFRIYRSDTQNFEPSDQTFVYQTSETQWDDNEGLFDNYYLLVASIDGVVTSDPISPGHISEINQINFPGVVELQPNYPNPFNPNTTIHFSLNEDQFVKLDVLGVDGVRVCSLLSEKLTGGYHSVIWNGKDSLGRSVPSGVYFYILETRHKKLVGKMVLIK